MFKGKIVLKVAGNSTNHVQRSLDKVQPNELFKCVQPETPIGNEGAVPEWSAQVLRSQADWK